jgi:rhamnogalacturonyl hydrolase YesR
MSLEREKECFERIKAYLDKQYQENDDMEAAKASIDLHRVWGYLQGVSRDCMAQWYKQKEERE